MSPKLKRLSGSDVISILSKFGFTVHSQRGSHVKLQRISSTGKKQILTIPLHKELDVGTLRAIVRQAGRYIPEEELIPFFTENKDIKKIYTLNSYSLLYLKKAIFKSKLHVSTNNQQP